MATAYTVFIDESFDGFMNLSKDDGYFCHAALMVPDTKLPDLDRFWAANRDKLAAEYKRVTAYAIQGELKSGSLNKLGFPARKAFGERLSRFLRKNECFVAGFYTTVSNKLLYHLRTEVARDDDEAKELPPDWETRLTSVKQKLLEDKPKEPGDAHLLLGLFHQTVSITLNWLGSVGASFNVVYDPRQKKEDRYLIRYAGDWLQREAEARKMLNVYRGTTAIVKSADSPGLMLVDLILRDVRFLFADVPELLAEQSSTTLILHSLQGNEPVLRTFAASPYKWGDRRPMSETLIERLRNPTPNSMLPLYLDRLADTKLSCEADFGESRVVNFGLGCFEDMTD
jgi:hypothetical protein